MVIVAGAGTLLICSHCSFAAVSADINGRWSFVKIVIEHGAVSQITITCVNILRGTITAFINTVRQACVNHIGITFSR